MMNKKVKYNDYLKKSFIQYAVIIIVITVLLIIGFFAFNYYFSILKKNKDVSDEITELFNEEYHNYYDEINNISKEEILLLFNEEDNVKTKRNISEQLYNFINSSKIKGYYVLLDDNRNIILSNLNKENQNIFNNSLFLRRVMSRIHDDYVTTTFTRDLELLNQNCIYSFTRSFIDEKNNYKAYLMLLMRDDDLNDLIRNLDEEVIIQDNYDNTIYASFNIQSDPGNKRPANKLSFALKDRHINNVDGVRMYVKSNKLIDEGINIYTLTSVEKSVEMLRFASIFLILLAIIIGISAYMMARLYTRLNEKTISELMSNLEIKNLEEQFNPHFVFNVMESVRFQIDEDPRKAQEMLMAFSTLMRYSINHGQTKVRLETDIDYLNDFLMLQKIRYNNLLSFDFEIPDELLDCLIPKLFLQPIVENSIRHGFVSGKPLHITIKAKQENEDIIFEVCDDGKGIDANKLKEIKDSFNEEVYDKTIQHIGLYNIEKVVNKLYGDKYHLDIHSEINKGTSVIITVPYEQEEDDV